MNLEDRILNRIDRLLDKGLDKLSLRDSVSYADTAEFSLAVTNIFATIYGTSSPQLDMVKEAQEWTRPIVIVQLLHGYLRELKEAIGAGLVVNVQSEAQGEVLGDFLDLARKAIAEEQKNVAAVLACAALEDALKRCASERGLEVEDKDMSEVVNALKAEGIIRGAQGRILSGYVRIRNKTFHAEWDAVDAASVNAIIAFTEIFLLQQFSAPIAVDSPAESSDEA